MHESHPGQKIELPERARKMLVSESGDGEQDPAYDLDKLKANRIASEGAAGEPASK